MSSTKKRKKIKCLKCHISLCNKNWSIYDQKRSYHICKKCRKIVDKKYHQSDLEYSRKQKNRYRMRRSAVIFAYGNVCTICGEDDYTKLMINGNINILYNNIVQKEGYKVTCYNCSKKPYKNKYIAKYKKDLLFQNGEYCYQCLEERIEKLTITADNKTLCYNCYKSKLAAEELEIECQKIKS